MHPNDLCPSDTLEQLEVLELHNGFKDCFPNIHHQGVTLERHKKYLDERKQNRNKYQNKKPQNYIVARRIAHIVNGMKNSGQLDRLIADAVELYPFPPDNKD